MKKLLEHVYVVEPNGHKHGGAQAVRYLARRLPGMWPLVPILHVPGSLPLWRWLYRVFSRRRHRISRVMQRT